MGKRRPALDRFWEKVDKSYDCWLWTGGTSQGYGSFADIPHHSVQTHRYIYELLVGPIPDGLVVDHLCFIKVCVNPDHLEPVTQAENVRRWAARITHCPQGHEYTPTNTYVWTQGVNKGHRKCRTCDNQRRKERWLALGRSRPPQ